MHLKFIVQQINQIQTILFTSTSLESPRVVFERHTNEQLVVFFPLSHWRMARLS